VKRSRDEQQPPGGSAEERRRLFEESRGLTEKRELDLEESSPEDEPESSEKSDRDDEGGAQ
jgi:hypothetical protein